MMLALLPIAQALMVGHVAVDITQNDVIFPKWPAMVPKMVSLHVLACWQRHQSEMISLGIAFANGLAGNDIENDITGSPAT